jgi:hypothetical protein
MELSIHIENSVQGAGTGLVTVGWFYTTEKSSIIYDPPVRVRSADLNRTHAKSASRCPAVINLESRHFEIRCPFDLNLQFLRDEKGKPTLRNLSGEASGIRSNKLREQVHMVDEKEWRYKDKPTIQVHLPYAFIADEPVYISQIAPFMHYNPNPLPGTIFGGRFPINVWPRPLQWAFEWCDISKPLVVKRGEPLCYVMFETMPQDRGIQLVEAEKTPELNAYCEQISGVVNYVNQTFSLFKTAEERRPAKLVVPREKP